MAYWARSAIAAGAAGALAVVALPSAPAHAAAFFFSTGNVNGLMATASQTSAGGQTEIESADDFVLGAATHITSATFTGLLTGTQPSVGTVNVEIYRVFPQDSTNPPSGNVPTRVNSPADVALLSRTSGAGLNFTTATLNVNFTAANSVVNGINPIPNQKTGGEGAKTGAEVEFDATFTTPIDLPAGHYFFVPQVDVTGGQFLWLSSVRPIVSPGTPFAPDLQAWIRNDSVGLAPDWLRVGTDIVGGTVDVAPTFNSAFTLTGETVPEPASMLLLATGLAGLGLLRRRR